MVTPMITEDCHGPKLLSCGAQVCALLQGAREREVTVVLDCGGADGPIPEELLSRVNYLSPNETELARLTGARLRATRHLCYGTVFEREWHMRQVHE